MAKKKESVLHRHVLDLYNGDKWVIMHNLPNNFGLNIDSAYDNYFVRTLTPSPLGFCNYIKGKAPGYVAYPEADIEDLKNLKK